MDLLKKYGGGWEKREWDSIFILGYICVFIILALIYCSNVIQFLNKKIKKKVNCFLMDYFCPCFYHFVNDLQSELVLIIFFLIFIKLNEVIIL